MPNVELRWSDYRGSAFRIIERVDDSREGVDALIGEDIERSLYDFDTGTLLLWTDSDGVLSGGRVQGDGSVQWSQSVRLDGDLRPLITWARGALRQPVAQ